MSHSLPHAQKLLKRYKGDERVMVVAVATAFEKAQYPWMADEEKIRQALNQKRWTFPVMRDKDEQTVRILGLMGRYGTPMTLVIDPFGVVRWHNFNPTPQTGRAIDETVERLLQSFYAPAIEDLDPRLKAYGEGKFAEAYAEAATILADESADEDLRKQAGQVQNNIGLGVRRLLGESDERRAAGYPATAQARLRKAVEVFKDTPAAGDAAERLAALKKDAGFKKELRAEKALDKVLAKKASRKKLDGLARSYKGTPVAARIETLLKEME